MPQMNAKDALQLAKKYHAKGELAQAEQVYTAVLQVDPHNAEAMHNIGLIYAAKGLLEDAIAAMKKAVELDRTNAEFHNNLGELYRKTGQLEHAQFHLSAAVELKPSYSEAFSNLGLVFKQINRFDDAKLCFAEALSANPKNVAALINTGNLLREEGLFEDAAECYQAALEISPDNPTALKTAAIAYYKLGEYNTSAKYYSRLTTGRPEMHAEKVDLALICLRNKDFRKGFQLLESRLKFQNILEGDQETLWRGTGQDEKILYVYAENEGLNSIGDTIMFARYVAELERFNTSKVIFKVQPELVQLLSDNMPDFVEVTDTAPDQFDKHSPLFSLGLILNARAKTIPQTDGYIKVKATEEIESDKMKIGVAGLDNKSDIKPLTDNSKLEVFNIDEYKTLDDKATVIDNMDMIIATDCDTAHLAGAMGKKTCLILDTHHDWRWFNAKTGKVSEWYASVTFYLKNADESLLDVISSINI